MSDAKLPRPVGHVGVTVPDIETAAEWYGKVMGFRLVAPPGDVDVTDGSHFAAICAGVFGPACRQLRMAQLATGNGVILELFEFTDPPVEAPQDTFPYWQSGITHYGIVDPDIEGMVERIKSAGGKARTDIWTLFEGQPYRIAYCEDPFGIVVEVCTHGSEHIFANQG